MHGSGMNGGAIRGVISGERSSCWSGNTSCGHRFGLGYETHGYSHVGIQILAFGCQVKSKQGWCKCIVQV